MPTASFSGRDLDQLRAGERVEVNDEKHDPFDFRALEGRQAR